VRRAERGGRARLTILAKLLLTFTVPTAALFALFAFVAHEVMRRDLEAELGTRLAQLAASAATQISGKYLVDLEPGPEDRKLYEGNRRKLEEVRAATGVERIYIFDQDFRARVDTDEGVAIGTTYFQAQLDRAEVARVFAGETASGVLFQGDDGAFYKAGYAPVTASDKDASIVLAVGVDASARFFDRLADLRRSLIVYGALLVTLLIGAAIVVATRLTRPIRHLAGAAERIGRGDLAAPIARTSGDEIGFLADTLEQMRRDLGARDQRMQAMLAGIAHEVRNPLGGIELWAGHLRDELPAGDERRGHVERIDRELGYLKAVVSDFLDYARRPALELAEQPLAPLVREVAELLAGEASAAGHILTVEAEPVQARFDRVQLRRALINLAKNAIQACAGQGRRAIRLSCRPGDGDGDGGGAVLEVWNDGPAIPAEALARIYEPFFTTREKGTGLGLAFVGDIVREHGGEIDLESTAAGTRFVIRLPRR
jgi:signal transduction histidine kinase